MCTQKDYNREDLAVISKRPHKLMFAKKFPDLLNKNIQEILQKDAKSMHLQSMGHMREAEANADGREGEATEFSMKYINLNKTEMITKEWDFVY